MPVSEDAMVAADMIGFMVGRQYLCTEVLTS